MLKHKSQDECKVGQNSDEEAIKIEPKIKEEFITHFTIQFSSIQFTESQKAMIAELVEANDVLGAQTLILNELEVQFGGAARAARDTMGGAITALGGLVGDQFERMGKGILEHFDPAIRRAIKSLEALASIQFLKDFKKTQLNFCGGQHFCYPLFTKTFRFRG